MRARWINPAIGVAGATLTIAAAFGEDVVRGPGWANVLAFLAYGVVLALRTTARVPAAFGFVAIVALLGAVLTPPPELITVSLGLPLFAYAAGGADDLVLRRYFLPALLAAIAVANLGAENSTAGDWVFPIAVTLAAFAAARNAVYRAAIASELHDAGLRVAQAQTEEALRAVAAERRRIARELHDVVAHSISVMVVQAGGARRILDRDTDRAEQAAAQIERTGRETLTEMRRLLGVMHGGVEPAGLEPSPTLEDLGALCTRAGATLLVTGEPHEVPAGLAIGAYRVVQEALEDSQRTLPGAQPEVEVAWNRATLEVRVADDRPFAGPELPGVRERVALYEGTLRTGPRDAGGGHQVTVTFPLSDHADAIAVQGA